MEHNMFNDDYHEEIFGFLTQPIKKILTEIPILSDEKLQYAFDLLIKSKSISHGKVYHAFLSELIKRPHISEHLEYQNLANIFLNLITQTGKSSEKNELENVVLFLIEHQHDLILNKPDSFEQYFINKCASIHNERLFEYCLQQSSEETLMSQLSKGKTLGHWLLYIQWGVGINLLQKEYPTFNQWKDEKGVTVQTYIDNQDLSRWISNCIR